VFPKRFARDLSALGRLDASPEALLDRITDLTARAVPDCAGAGALVWRDDQISGAAASHPELGELLELQTALGQGPFWEARRTGEMVVVADLSTESRWPRYSEAALRHGVRSSLALPVRAGAALVTIGLAAVRPHVFDVPGAESLAVLVAEQLAVVAGNAERYQAVTLEASHMRHAFDSWDVISQAKGILMQAHGLDADAAFELLRRNSQRSQQKLADVARALIAEYTARPGPSPLARDLSPG
jgi:GAF domain-containing protein